MVKIFYTETRSLEGAVCVHGPHPDQDQWGKDDQPLHTLYSRFMSSTSRAMYVLGRIQHCRRCNRIIHKMGRQKKLDSLRAAVEKCVGYNIACVYDVDLNHVDCLKDCDKILRNRIQQRLEASRRSVEQKQTEYDLMSAFIPEDDQFSLTCKSKLLRLFNFELDELVKVHTNSSLEDKLYRNAPYYAGNLRWIRTMITRISQTMNWFGKNDKIFSQCSGSKRVIAKYNAFLTDLHEMECKIIMEWRKIVLTSKVDHQINFSLQMTHQSQRNECQVVEPIGASRLIKECKTITKMGFDIDNQMKTLIEHEPMLKRAGWRIKARAYQYNVIFKELGSFFSYLMNEGFKGSNNICSYGVVTLPWNDIAKVNAFVDRLEKDLKWFQSSTIPLVTNLKYFKRLLRKMRYSTMSICADEQVLKQYHHHQLPPFYLLSYFTMIIKKFIDNMILQLQSMAVEASRALCRLIDMMFRLDLETEDPNLRTKRQRLPKKKIECQCCKAITTALYDCYVNSLKSYRNTIMMPSTQRSFIQKITLNISTLLGPSSISSVPTIENLCEAIEKGFIEIIQSSKRLEWRQRKGKSGFGGDAGIEKNDCVTVQSVFEKLSSDPIVCMLALNLRGSLEKLKAFIVNHLFSLESSIEMLWRRSWPESSDIAEIRSECSQRLSILDKIVPDSIAVSNSCIRLNHVNLKHQVKTLIQDSAEAALTDIKTSHIA